ncbi:helix-turn-helix transcriptional regulator [Streptomyces sp. NBC_01408]|uniref:ArsR/SmtB family transcription factor n=1 Tax=Streptomyces sp. NBC_01408 TaxID=2903855 RepID=UPI00224F559A|nr:winged helix-turn-helix domain-containing protein [Streptomyces sp. NBC_01408]MCX4692915.1 winged helix-turn-helix domain-containing protein [Streptomyces sp. NBC_01408]
MQSVQFSMDDLAQLKIMPTVGPVAEAVFAADLLRRAGGGPAFARWRDATSLRLRRTTAVQPAPRTVRPPVAQSAGRAGDGGAWLFDLMEQDAEQGEAATAPDSMITRIRQVGIEPYWPKARAHLQIDREYRCRIMAGGGIERMLSNLHSWVGWRPPTLSIASGRDDVIELRGRGLVIVPSLFIDRPRIFTGQPGEQRAPILVYPTLLDQDAAESLWESAGTEDRALAALVGRTRARVLEALSETCNTSELGRRLGISPAAASQHATVLRGAGLITSRRRYNTMLHSLTPLGSALVTMGSPLPRPLAGHGLSAEQGAAASG